MSLTLVSTPIGNPDDITLRAIETLKVSQSIICEELKPARVLLKRLCIPEKPLYELNEHSQESELKELIELCRSKKMALISDCGTPGFSDPGADLVKACVKEKIQVDVNPGASSLMALIALCGIELKEFYFVGFLPAERNERAKKLEQLQWVKVPMVFMDTPYRLGSTIKELALVWPKRSGIVGVDLTGGHHQVHRDLLGELSKKEWPKLPFMIIVKNRIYKVAPARKI